MAHRTLSSLKGRMSIKHLIVPAHSRSLHMCQPFFLPHHPIQDTLTILPFGIVINCQFLSFIIYWPYFLESLLFLVYYCFLHWLESQTIPFGQLLYFQGTRIFSPQLSFHSLLTSDENNVSSKIWSEEHSGQSSAWWWRLPLVKTFTFIRFF